MTKDELKILKRISWKFDDCTPCDKRSPSANFISSYILTHAMPNGDIDENIVRNGMTACRNCGVQNCPIVQLRDFVETSEWELSLTENKTLDV